MEFLVNYAWLWGVIGLVLAFIIYKYVMTFSPGDEVMVEIMERIHAGAMVFLKREYKIIAIFVVIVFLILFFSLENRMSSVAFLSGAVRFQDVCRTDCFVHEYPLQDYKVAHRGPQFGWTGRVVKIHRNLFR